MLMKVYSLLTAAGMVVGAFAPSSLAQAPQAAGNSAFAGHIDIDVRKSTPAWPKPVTAPNGAPNILLILIDDVGFSTTSTFGGPVDTPVFSQLAAQGLRYNAFHVNALCSPSRAALLSGRNASQIGFGTVAELGAGYPGYNTLWPKSSASIAEVLRENGYNTAAFGKWHNTPPWQVSPAGPFDRWPTGLGFDYYYGFMSGADNQNYPRIYRDTTPVEPASTPEKGYHFTDDLTSDAIHWLHQQDAASGGKPFFLYFATGATHSPHQTPKEWVAKYKGKFDQGWDRLREENYQRELQLGVIPANAKDTPRPEGLPAWDSLSPEEKKLVAHEAEVYAGYAAQTDYEVGRLLQAVKDEGRLDNTLVIWIFGDNGGSAQGGPLGTDAHDVRGNATSVAERLAAEDELGSDAYMNHFAAAWAWSLTAPFQGTKEDASHLGGSRDPMIISWPARIKQVGGLRSQFSHLNDIAPTIYEAAGIAPPKEVNGVPQTPLEGTSLLYTFDHPDAPSRHHIQYFAMSGNRGIYKDGWWAGDRLRYTWEPNGIAGGEAEQPKDYDIHPWELYNLNDDYSQANDLAAKYPDKLKELEQLFDEEAKRNQVYPLLPTYGDLPSVHEPGQTEFVYRDGVERLTRHVSPPLAGKNYTLTADVDVPQSGANGVIVAQGGKYGGFSLFVKDKHLIYEINAFGNCSGRVVSTDPLPQGKAHIVISLSRAKGERDTHQAVLAAGRARPGSATLEVNGKPEGSGQFTNVNGGGGETLDVGSDLGSPVSPDYRSPNRFNGTIETVTFRIH
jgi:arylsulfatase A-like enzyme